MQIGDRIKDRREQLGLSQEKLASALGYKSRSSINKIERNHRNLTQRKIKAIADVLQTTPDYIMGWTEEQKASAAQKRNTYKQEVLNAFDSLPDECIERFVKMVRHFAGKF